MFEYRGTTSGSQPKSDAGEAPPKPEPDREEAERFLAALDPKATRFTFQVFDDDKERAKKYKAEHKGKSDPELTRIVHGTIARRWSDLVDLNGRGCGIYITVNETDFEGRTEKNIKRVRALFVDLDGTPLPAEYHARPHIIVESSPGRYHVYWLVKVYLDSTPIALPYHLLEKPEVLILGAGGGTDILLALLHDAPTIDAVEINPQLVRLVAERFAAFAGRLYERPGVRVITPAGDKGSRLRDKRTDSIFSISLISSMVR
jgi:hypothetical protein